MESELVGQLLAAVAGAGVLVSGLVQAVKTIAFPTSWQHGRAVLALTALLALAAVILGALAGGLELASPGALLAIATAWLTVYSSAVATHETVKKGKAIATGTTDPTGPDDAASPDAATR